FQRLNLITEKFGMELERDKYTTATIAKSKTFVQFTLKSSTPGTSHTTKVTFSGLAAGTFDVFVNNAPAGTVTATSGKQTTVSLNIGASQTYDIKLQQGTSSPPPEVIAAYLFDETSGTTAADASGNGNQAVLHGGTTWVSGKNGNALGLNGTDAYASLPSGIVSDIDDFTIAAWVKVDTSSNWARIFDFGTGTNTYMFLTPKAAGAGLRFAITTNSNGAEQQLNAAALPTGVWKHVAVTLQGSTGRLYVDGVQVATNPNMTLKPSSLGSTNLNYIGKSQWADPYFHGSIDEFKIYSRALTAAEVAELANAAPTLTNIAPLGTASTSYVSPWESLAGLNDGYEPTSSADRGHPVYGNWDNPGTTQWVQYDFSQNYTISKVDVYWFDDNLGIDLPASCSIQYWDGTAWADVSNPVGLGVLGNQYNTTTFTPITTNKIRLNITAKENFSTGIETWKVYGY
ncbi:MAG TPA: LamG domain-containing protein, partial [Bacilli bacterium]